jgi:hypothetical protein
MPLRTSDIKAPFLAALDAIGHPAELTEIADWINTHMPVTRGPVKTNGTMGRTRDALEAEGAIERDVGRYRRAARKKPLARGLTPEQFELRARMVLARHAGEWHCLASGGIRSALRVL